MTITIIIIYGCVNFCNTKYNFINYIQAFTLDIIRYNLKKYTMIFYFTLKESMFYL